MRYILPMTASFPYALLPQRGLLRLSGEDATAFLQGLVTNDVARLREQGLLYAALLTPQGKFLHDFFLWRQEDGVLVEAERSRLDDLSRRLAMYRLRSRVTIEKVEGLSVAALWPQSPQELPSLAPSLILCPDPRMGALGWRALGPEQELRSTLAAFGPETGAEAYQRLRLGLGVPDGAADLKAEKSFPLQFGFEDLHAVDFKKGCYVGQEVTARTKHLGQLRKFLYRVEGAQALPPSGTQIMLGGEAAGELLSQEGQTGLALLQVESVRQARMSGQPLYCGGAAVSAALPSWVRNMPEA